MRNSIMGKSYLASGVFWVRAGERAIKSFAQAVLVGMGASTVAIQSVDWLLVLGSALSMGLVSILTSIVTPRQVLADGDSLLDYGQDNNSVS